MDTMPILRQMTLLYKEGERRFNVLTIVERIEPDMPDFVWTPKEKIATKEGLFELIINDYSLYEGWTVDSNHWLERAGVESLGKLEPRQARGQYSVLSREFDDSGLTKVLPFRNGPYYVVQYIAHTDFWKEKLEEVDWRDQLATLIKMNLGWDLAQSYELLGSVLMVWHHAIIHDIHLTATDNPPGMLCSVSSRVPQDMKIILKVIDRDKDQSVLGERVFDMNIAERRKLLQMEQPVTRPDVEAYDEHGELIFSMKKIAFIKRIVMNVGLVDGVTGKKTGEFSRDIIEIDRKRHLEDVVKRRKDVEGRIMNSLKGLSKEDAEIILEEVKHKIAEAHER